MKTARILASSAALFTALTLSAMAAGQAATGETPPAWPKKPGFSFRLGTYFSTNSTQIRVDGEDGQGTEFDLTDVLDIPANAIVFRVRGDIRAVKWFGIEAEYYRIGRSSTTVIDREIIVGDEVFEIDETVSTSFISSYVDLAFKFYIIHKQRLDLGLWLGGTVHFVDFSLEAQPSDLGVVRKETWFPIPAVGAHFSYSLLPRLYLYGKGGFFFYKISDTNEFNSTRFDISLDYYFWKMVGVGVTYAYQDGSVSADRDAYRGLFKHRSSGAQIYAMIGF
jgi:hypothetical protein